jgi:DUF917 family protein
VTSSPPAAGLTGIALPQLPALAAGAMLLGSGGGGLVTVPEMLLRQRLGSIPVVLAADLPTDALVVHLGVVGAPDVHDERLIDPADLAAAARAVVAHVGGELAAVGIIEIGGMNAPTALLGALELGVPVVDGDIMGRAFPRIEMSTLAVAGRPATPLALVGPGGGTVVVTRGTPKLAEALVASTVRAMGGAAALALFPTTAGVLVDHGVVGSLSTCVALGEAILAVGQSGAHAIVDALGGRVLVEGSVDEIHTRSGGAPGSVTLAVPGGSVARIDHLDEFLAVSHEGRVVACTPDVLNALDSSTLLPLRPEQIRHGQAVVVFALPALHEWPAGAVDPAAFGLDLGVDW